MSEELIPHVGTSRLAGVLRRHEDQVLGHQRPQLEWGELVDVGSANAPILALMPDTWTAAPFLPGDYSIVEPLRLGLIRTELAEVPPSAVGDHGDHAHGEHRHDLEYPIRPLEAGDRVLIAWVSGAPTIIGRLSP